ncbi:FecR family protein [Sphingobacterium sp. MYb388]|uniref:FecR family protein n=1 Tax=Sphingobacterium sp. MYb388 TaxID=2745437 RepID=UPI00309D37D4
MEFDKKQAWQNITHRIDKTTYRRKRRLKAIHTCATILIIVAGFFTWKHMVTEQPVNMILVSTASNEIKSIKLSDGSTLVINNNSSLRYPEKLDKNLRKVELLHGEAIFNIAKDPERPFQVSVDDSQIEVLGTIFNINAYTSKISVTLAEGSIRFSNKNFNCLLVPGEQLTFDANEGKAKRQTVEAYALIDWKNNNWVFQDIPLDEVLSQIAAQKKLIFKKANPNKQYPKITVYQNQADIALPQFMQLLQHLSKSDIHLDQHSILLK